MNSSRPRIALVAGEASGDQLGAALIEQLKLRYPQARFGGIGGARMRAAGMETWWDCEELAVFGLFEVLSHFPRLLKLRRALERRIVEFDPDAFIGIDAPDFNLGLEIKLRRAGLKTVHYVSPTVWAWRQRRVRKIARAADRVLCLFPFEPEFYSRHDVDARYVGHPMADRIDPDKNPAAARRELGLDPDATTVALLPGSRVSEATRLSEPMIGAARMLAERRGGMQFVSALANERVRAVLEDEMKRQSFETIRLVDGHSLRVMAAADVVICASGTATLETLLVNRPMVMTYKLAAATYQFAKQLRIIRPQAFALPNILAGEALIPELIQDESNAENLARETARWLDDASAREQLSARFEELHGQLLCNAAERAAEAVAELIGKV